MTEPVFLHVGLPKTGTTELQKVLWENRAHLASAGVVYPGRVRGAHYHAAMDLLGWKRAPEVGAWAALAATARESAGRVVLSHEVLAGATPPQVARMLDDLAPRDVHVVITVRDFSRIVSATWQERAKNREVEDWAQFLADVAAGPSGKHPFWRFQDAARVVGLFAEHVPGDRIHVITVPPVHEDPNLLLRRFAEVVGFSLDGLTISGRPANQSIGAVEIAVLQQVNRASRHLSWEQYARLIKNHVVKDILAARTGQLRVVLPEAARPWVDAETERIREAVRTQGCHLVGDLAELEPRGIGVRDAAKETDAPNTVPEAEVLATTATVLVELAEEVGRLRARLRRRLVATVEGSAAEGIVDRARALVGRLRRRTRSD